MNKLVMFIFGAAVGLASAMFLQLSPVRTAGAGADPDATRNGDVNGDGEINLADAVYLLNWLFRGGAGPVEIDCQGQPPAPAARFRLQNTLICDPLGTIPSLQICDAVTKAMSGGEPGDCEALGVRESCPLKLTAEECAHLEICADFRVEAGHVYDFILVLEGEQPELQWYDQELNPDGTCPPAPLLGDPPDGSLAERCSPVPPLPLPPQVRFSNDLFCNGQVVGARLSICESIIAEVLGGEQGECTAISASESCAVSVLADSECGLVAACKELPVLVNHVYDFVLKADGGVVWFDRSVEADGSCPPPILDGEPPTGQFDARCEGRG